MRLLRWRNCCVVSPWIVVRVAMDLQSSSLYSVIGSCRKFSACPVKSAGEQTGHFNFTGPQMNRSRRARS